MKSIYIRAGDTSESESRRVIIRLEAITLVHENRQVLQGKKIQQAESKLLRRWMFDEVCGAGV